MKKRQAYKFRIEPNGCQIRAMCQFAGNARNVWNLCLGQQQKNHVAGEKYTNSFGMNNWLPAWKKEYAYLQSSPSQTLQQVTKDLHAAFKKFFDKQAGFPKFKKKGKSTDSFRFPQGYKLDETNSRIFLPKIGWIRYRKSRVVLGDIKNVTVSYKTGRWYVSIQTEHDAIVQPHPATHAIGIDVGIDVFAATSDGELIAPINSFKTHQVKLAKYQRRMSHKRKFSQNWQKEKAKVQKVQSKIAHVRADFLHKLSTTISKNHAMIVVEDLKVANMSKSAAGTIDAPGSNVSQKRGLNRSILDQGWGEFRRQLEYKQAWRQGVFLAVNPKNTSRTCFCCGFVAAENRVNQSRFVCMQCNHKDNADVNAARNILAAGHAVLACGDPARLGWSMKQAPTEAIRAVA